MHLKEELKNRGFMNQFSDEKLFDLYNKWWHSFYCGFDPTADSLHLGNFVMFMSAVNFMKRWNKFYLLLGGATGMIGDPSFKNSDRAFLSEGDITNNISALNVQVKQILANLTKLSGYSFDFEIVNNADFYKDMSFLKFLREVGKYITVNTMMNKESVKKRIEDPDKSISYTEFSYMLIQGYDFVHLLDKKWVQMQICGSDQWGNGVTWIELIRKKLNKESFVFTSPLLLDSTGKKFGKSEWNAIWLDSMKNSPYYVYQYFMNTADWDIERYFKIFSLLDFVEIENIVNKHSDNPWLRYGQQKLAAYVVEIIFGTVASNQSQKISEMLFGKQDKLELLKSMEENDLKALMRETGWITIKKTDLPLKIIDICTKTEVCKSNGEAKKLIQSWGIYINEEKVKDIQKTYTKADLINNIILIRKGKKVFKIINFK